MNQNEKTVMVTGGAGYIGSLLLRKLLQENFNVVCVDKLSFGGESLLGVWDHPNFTFHKIDIVDFPSVTAVLKRHKPWGIVHLAAIVGDPACKNEPELATKTNWDASVNLVNEATKAGVERFVFASTCSNYGKSADPESFVDENSPLGPVSLYAELKVKFEKYLMNELDRSAGLCATALRFATVYGLSHRMRFDLTVNEFTKDIAKGRPLQIFGGQFWRPYCHVSDFSRAILKVLQAPRELVAFDVFNIGSTEENYTKSMLAHLLQKVEPNAVIKSVHKTEDPRDYRVNFAKAKRVLDFTPSKTVPDGIQEVFDLVRMGVIANPDDQRYYNIPYSI